MDRLNSESAEIIDLFPIAEDIIRSFGKREAEKEYGVQHPPVKLSGIRCVAFDVYGTILHPLTERIGITREKADISPWNELLIGLNGGSRDNVDGTLCRTLYFEAIRKKHQESAEAGNDHPEVDIITIWHEVLDRLNSAGVLQTRVTPELIVRTAVTAECLLNPVGYEPSAPEVYQRLRAHGIVLAIVSNAQFYTPILLKVYFGMSIDSLGFSRDLCLWSYLSGRGKPSPVLFQTLRERLRELYGIMPAETLIIGNDIVNDVAAPASAGFKTALFGNVTNGTATRQPDAVIRRFRTIFDLVI